MRDYKLPALAAIDLAYRTTGEKLQTDKLRSVASAFVGNVERVVSTGRFPARLLNLSGHFLYVWKRAEHQVLGGDAHKMDSKHFQEIVEACKKIADEDHEKSGQPGLPKLFSQEWIELLDGPPSQVQQRFEGTFSLIEGMVACTGDFLANGIEPTLSSMVVGTWTAFETFAGDLWVAVLNEHPAELALLAGTEKRIARRAGTRNEEPESESGDSKGSEKLVSLQWLHDITRGDYDLSRRMGDVLKIRFTWSVLAEIRRAYSLAFHEKIDRSVVGTIDEALADEALDGLNIVRNLLVHRGGIADARYVKNSKRIGAIPRLEEQQPLRLDGEIVKSLVDPVVACCLKLLATLDGWLSDEFGA